MTRGAAQDRFTPAPLGGLQLHGLVGDRLTGLRENRLLPHEDDFLLWPFRTHCPVVRDEYYRSFWSTPTVRGDWASVYENGEPPPHPEITWSDWQGEFIGTWVAAASVAAASAHDDELWAKIDRLVHEWLSMQEPNGYLGTYDEADRWRSWDVWIQAHNLTGLLTYHDCRGDLRALEAAERIADRVLADFGPGRRSLGDTGPGGTGFASSVIVEPLVLLYRATGTARYLEFARWIVDVDWTESGSGSKLVDSLRDSGRVPDEMHGITTLLVFAGLVELYRVTGENTYLDMVLRAWKNIVRSHLYVTGTMTAGETLRGSHELPNDGVQLVGETCAAMGWINLNLSLGRLLGEARFFDAVEQSLYNSLLAAQSPDGRGWSYYVGLRDAKRYCWHTDPECCPTKGARALSLVPLACVGTDDQGVCVNLYEALEADLNLPSGEQVHLSVKTKYPFAGDVKMQLTLDSPQRFTLRLRLPAWCEERDLRVAGERVHWVAESGYAVIDREWQNGDSVQIDFAMPVQVLVDTLGNRGRVALRRGPLVYAVDTSYLPEWQLLDDVTLRLDPENLAEGVEAVAADGSVHLITERVWLRARTDISQRYVPVDTVGEIDTDTVRLVPFFEAGNRDIGSYRDGVWSCLAEQRLLRQPTYQVWNPVAFG